MKKIEIQRVRNGWIITNTWETNFSEEIALKEVDVIKNIVYFLGLISTVEFDNKDRILEELAKLFPYSREELGISPLSDEEKEPVPD